MPVYKKASPQFASWEFVKDLWPNRRVSFCGSNHLSGQVYAFSQYWRKDTYSWLQIALRSSFHLIPYADQHFLTFPENFHQYTSDNTTYINPQRSVLYSFSRICFTHVIDDSKWQRWMDYFVGFGIFQIRLASLESQDKPCENETCLHITLVQSTAPTKLARIWFT